VQGFPRRSDVSARLNEAGADVFDCIERFCNAIWHHSAIGYISPVEFERKIELA
jgi:putative transposase